MAIEVRIRIFKDPWSATTHFVGFLAAIVGASVLVWRAMGKTTSLVGASIYGIALIGLFLASSLYHFFDLGERVNHWLRRVDHAAIFLFIASCMVLPALRVLSGTPATLFLAVAGTLGLAGAIYKLVWFKAPLWVEMTGYLGLGWLSLLIVPRALEVLGWGPIALLVGGGLLYTLGAVVFILERPDPWPRVFGHHEIWHLFVLGGAGSHYALIYGLV